jgi:Raf kinase inhibitor-like YbhB/YbcL family protein
MYALSLLMSVALASGPFNVTSPVTASGMGDRQVFNGFGCTGENQSPAIEWSGLPVGTKSLALMVHDPDAPTGGAGWWHWVVYDIPATETALPEGVTTTAGLPAGAKQGPTDFGRPGWGGPCPPEGHGSHRYVFTLYALGSEVLQVPEGATASMIGYLAQHGALGTANFEVSYGR